VPCGITQCYLPLGRGDIPAFTPANYSWYSIQWPWRNARLSRPTWLGYISRWYTYSKTVTHPSTNRAQCWATSFIWWTHTLSWRGGKGKTWRVHVYESIIQMTAVHSAQEWTINVPVDVGTHTWNNSRQSVEVFPVWILCVWWQTGNVAVRTAVSLLHNNSNTSAIFRRDVIYTWKYSIYRGILQWLESLPKTHCNKLSNI